MSKKTTVKRAFDPKKMLLSRRSPFTMQEAYKTLRTNVAFSIPGSGCKCIGVVSANRGDGKSSVSCNLAISFAQINKRVVLIDCDLRLPTIATKLGIDSKPGLSNYLAGNCEELPIYHLESYGLDVIPSGNIPPEPTTLIQSQGMEDMLQELRSLYDIIIIDLPPIVIVSDAALISKDIDGYLMVIRHNFSEISKIDESLRQLQFADAKIIGFVYNGKTSHKKYYKSKNYYYYKNN